MLRFIVFAKIKGLLMPGIHKMHALMRGMAKFGWKMLMPVPISRDRESSML